MASTCEERENIYPTLPVLISPCTMNRLCGASLRAGRQWLHHETGATKNSGGVAGELCREITSATELPTRCSSITSLLWNSEKSSIADLSDRNSKSLADRRRSRTRQIAEELHLSVKTVNPIQAHIKEKLSLRSARELMQHAIQ